MYYIQKDILFTYKGLNAVNYKLLHDIDTMQACSEESQRGVACHTLPFRV